ncbi:flagellar basal body-associated FliL family protein [Halodurantibacterium flavum]|uniref:Flagellar protein FliL n=1 Tax=Halodurantibacterium flavum TaxID=1382802 RepID=A0ABW4S850_9RHOB
MTRILPIIIAMLGIVAGAGAGFFLRPGPEPQADVATAQHSRPTTIIPMANQFVIPLVEGGRVTSMAVLSISIEADAESAAEVEQRLPRLQDAFLQVMFDHANAGGFYGNFTSSNTRSQLRGALREQAQAVAGPIVRDVLITEYRRQDS